MYKGVKFREDWIWRTKIVAEMIPEGSRVIEFGSGEKRLQEFLPKNCSYTGYDIEDFDLESDIWPTLPEYDVAVFCGILEWLDDPIEVIKKANPNIAIITYNIFLRHINGVMERKKAGWKNHYSDFQLIALIASSTSLNVVLEDKFWRGQLIIKMGRKSKGEI